MYGATSIAAVGAGRPRSNTRSSTTAICAKVGASDCVWDAVRSHPHRAAVPLKRRPAGATSSSPRARRTFNDRSRDAVAATILVGQSARCGSHRPSCSVNHTSFVASKWGGASPQPPARARLPRAMQAVRAPRSATSCCSGPRQDGADRSAWWRAPMSCAGGCVLARLVAGASPSRISIERGHSRPLPKGSASAGTPASAGGNARARHRRSEILDARIAAGDAPPSRARDCWFSASRRDRIELEIDHGSGSCRATRSMSKRCAPRRGARIRSSHGRDGRRRRRGSSARNSADARTQATGVFNRPSRLGGAASSVPGADTTGSSTARCGSRAAAPKQDRGNLAGQSMSGPYGLRSWTSRSPRWSAPHSARGPSPERRSLHAELRAGRASRSAVRRDDLHTLCRRAPRREPAHR